MNNYWHRTYAARRGGEYTCRFRISLLGAGPGGDPAEPVRRGWAACDPLYVSPPYSNSATGPLGAQGTALSIADPGVHVVGAKLADDGEGAIVKLLDAAGTARGVPVGPGAFEFRAARRSEEHTSELQSPCNLVCRLLLEKKKKKHRQITAAKELAHMICRICG